MSSSSARGRALDRRTKDFQSQTGTSLSTIPKGRLIWGMHALREYYRSFDKSPLALLVDRARLQRDLELQELVSLFSPLVQPRLICRENLDQLVSYRWHQGVAAIVSPLPLLSLEELLAAVTADPDQKAPLLIVDGIKDPQNLGAMLRSASAFGARAVVIAQDRSSPLTDLALHVSCGACEHLIYARVANLVRALKTMKKSGFWIIGTVADGGSPCFSVDLPIPSAFVFGSEHKGIRPNIRRHCDLLLTLPMPGPIQSLNVGAATATFFYEALRQRLQTSTLPNIQSNLRPRST